MPTDIPTGEALAKWLEEFGTIDETAAFSVANVNAVLRVWAIVVSKYPTAVAIIKALRAENEGLRVLAAEAEQSHCDELREVEHRSKQSGFEAGKRGSWL